MMPMEPGMEEAEKKLEEGMVAPKMPEGEEPPAEEEHHEEAEVAEEEE